MNPDGIPDEWTDLTKDELLAREDTSDDKFRTEEEYREHVEGLHEVFEVHATAIMLARMFDDGHITFGEYLDLTENLSEYEDEAPATLM